MEAHRINIENTLHYILAGNAISTFKNIETNNRYTFKIRLSKDKRVYFVSVLYGPNNEFDYLYIGIIRNSNNFAWTSGSKVKENDLRVKVFKYLFHHILKNDLPECIEVWHEGRCGRCGRILTVPKSIEIGIGPECSKIMSYC